jgi:hypothetical protein
MTETSLSRKRRMRPSSHTGSSVPSSSTVPAMCFMAGTSWTMLLPSVVLPHPDSPASPMISPSSSVKVTPSSAFYDNDVMAVAAVAVTQEVGVRIPQDISLVAWEDSPLCRLVHPPLTTCTAT